VVSRSGIVGLRFADEAETVNALVPELKKLGVEAIVVLIHEGGSIKGAWHDKSCPGFEGDILDVLKRLDKAVDLVVSGHTHKAYTCKIDGRWVTSAGDYGRFVTRIDLKLDPKSRDIIDIDAENTLVDPEKFPADPRITRIIEEYEKLVAPRANRVVGHVGRELLAAQNTAGESTLGQVIADGQLLASRPAGAQIAFMNPGGIRAALHPRKPEGTVNYGDIFTVQPFGNSLVTMSLTGAQIVELLEGQFPREPGGWTRMLAVSKGFSYTWDNAAPHGRKVVAGSLRLNGEPVDPARKYRVTVNSFMADGGDGFQVLRQGTDREGGMLDLDAFEAWLKVNATQAAPYQPGPLNRVTRLN
jgi:5'-nucleotidase